MWYLYCRKSTDKQNETSFQVQEEYLRGQAEKLGETEVQVVTETGSGSSIEGRPLFKRLLEESQSGDVLALYDSSRGFRNTEDALRTASVLSLKGVRLYISDKFINVDNPIDKMLFSISSSFDSYQREIQAKKAKEGQTKVFEEGNWLFCSTLFGYNLVRIGKNKTVSVIEEEAKIVRFIFEKYSSGWSVKKLLGELQGLPLQRQSNFTLKKISRILQQPIYMGFYPDSTIDNKVLPRYTRSELEAHLVKSNYYTPIIEESLFWECWERYRKVTPTHSRPWQLRWTKHSLSGIIRCSSCGKGLSRFEHTHCYCTEDHSPNCETKYRTKFDERWLEKVMSLCFYLTFMAGDEIGSFFSEQQQQLYKDKSEIEQAMTDIDKALSEIQVKTDRLVDAISDGIISSNDAKRRMESLRTEQQSLSDRKSNLQKDLSLVEEDIDSFLELSCEDVIDQFPSRERELYQKFIKCAYAYKDKIEVEYLNGKKFTIPRGKRHNHTTDSVIVTSTYQDDSFQFVYTTDSVTLVKSEVEPYDRYIQELLDKAWNLVNEKETTDDTETDR